MQVVDVEVKTAVGVFLAGLEAAQFLFEGRAVVAGVDVTVGDPHVVEAFRAFGDGLASVSGENRFVAGAVDDSVETGLQVMDFQDIAQLGGLRQDAVSGVVVHKAAPCLRQCGSVFQQILVAGRHGTDAPKDLSVRAEHVVTVLAGVIIDQEAVRCFAEIKRAEQPFVERDGFDARDLFGFRVDGPSG